MTNEAAVFDEAGSAAPAQPDLATKSPALVDQLVLAAWCGLVAGLAEVAAIVLRKELFDPNQLYGMSRHFVWLIPLSNLCLFLALGACAAVACRAWPRPGRWLFPRVMGALVLLPVFLVAFPRIYGLAWLVVTFGIAARLVPALERDPRAFARVVKVSFPLALAALLVMVAGPSARGRIEQSRALARPLPPPGSPNVLLIVLDTVAAGHLSLYGYDRPTSTTLAELAGRGIRFDAARAASSWTLPSHATIFTGRWMHETSVGWLNPLDQARPTLAEFLRGKGYATAGIIANTAYCASDSGLDRGFGRYEDYIFPQLSAFKMAVVVKRVLAGVQSLVQLAEGRGELTAITRPLDQLAACFTSDRKGAATVNRQVLDWLASRSQPERPFFAFVNYADAHIPYQLPPDRMRRFGVEPSDSRRRALIERWGDMDKAGIPAQELAAVIGAYDDCVADLDEQLGMLIDELDRRRVLDETWLIVTSDHGESFGEHKGVYCHGTSLYQTELHVPLLVVPPAGRAPGQVVGETVSLRDLAATIVDLLGLQGGSPFPGNSLRPFWSENRPTAPPEARAKDAALAEVVPGDPLNRDSWGLPRKAWPLGAIDDGEWTYIRREGDVREELFHRRVDPREQRNLAGDPAVRPTLERMQRHLGRLTDGPLLPRRFSR